jgi:hypothetical protein
MSKKNCFFSKFPDEFELLLKLHKIIYLKLNLNFGGENDSNFDKSKLFDVVGVECKLLTTLQNILGILILVFIKST